jgi:hypothetical protein
MAQAHITLERPARVPALWLRAAALRDSVRARRQARQQIARLLAQRQAGVETGARV